jgi:pyruvate carboxylase
LVAAIEAGVDAVDAASAALAGTTSQPALSALVAATDHTDRATGLSLDAVCDLEPYWEATRRLYAPFESGLPAPTGRVYTHEIPGGQLSNLRQQAIALGLGEKFEQIEDMYAAANDILGNIVKVTPSSKVVGDLALSLVAGDADPAAFAEDPGSFDVPDSVLGFLSGELGDPPGGWPEPFRSKALADRAVTPKTETLSAADTMTLTGPATGSALRTTLNRLLFPGPTKAFADSRERYSDLSVLPTRDFLYGLDFDDEHDVYLGEGVRLILGVESISQPDERGFRTVMCTINGQLRPVSVRDRSVSSDAPAQERADLGVPGQIGAPFDGVVSVVVEAGAVVEAGQTVATIEAMKMEAAITTPIAGTVERLALDGPRTLEGGDLVVVVRPQTSA